MLSKRGTADARLWLSDQCGQLFCLALALAAGLCPTAAVNVANFQRFIAAPVGIAEAEARNGKKHHVELTGDFITASRSAVTWTRFFVPPFVSSLSHQPD